MFAHVGVCVLNDAHRKKNLPKRTHTHIQAFGLFIKDLSGNDQSCIEEESNDFSMKDNVSFPSH